MLDIQRSASMQSEEGDRDNGGEGGANNTVADRYNALQVGKH